MKKYIVWLGAAAVITIIFGTIYGGLQQSLRLSANDPQIQMAEDTAIQLNLGNSPSSLSSAKVNMATSQAPFIIVYNEQGQPVSGTGYLNDTLAKAPIGILQDSNSKNYHAVTWQPADGVRIAAITVKANHQYVLSGRSITEVENREDRVMWLVGIGWFLSILAITATYMLAAKSKSAKS